MTKKEFADKLVEEGVFSFKKESEVKVNKILDIITNVLKSGEGINFIGWGRFEIAEKSERVGRNPKTGEEIKIPAKKVIKFKPGKELTI